MATVRSVIETAYGAEIAEKILDSYKEVESNYAFKKWKPSELDAGHFVESVRRLIEQELFGTYTPFNKKLEDFKDSVLTKYESSPGGHESFRVLIPRVLKAVYNIRSRRGVGHISSVSANEMDATIILYSVKWVLSEIVRLKSQLSIPETQALVDELIERQIELIWKKGGVTRVLSTSLKAEQEVLVLLYDKDEQQDEALCKSVEYTNLSRFKKEILKKKLHDRKLIMYDVDGTCSLSPLGRAQAERLFQDHAT